MEGRLSIASLYNGSAGFELIQAISGFRGGALAEIGEAIELLPAVVGMPREHGFVASQPGENLGILQIAAEGGRDWHGVVWQFSPAGSVCEDPCGAGIRRQVPFRRGGRL